MSCRDCCEGLPARVPEGGVLYLSQPPSRYPGPGLEATLRRLGLGFTEAAPAILAVPLGPGLLNRLAAELAVALNPAELAGVKSLLLGDGRAPAFADLARMQPLATLVAKVRGEWLAEMIREDRLVTHFQPIVCGHDTSKVFAYECLLRGVDRDGSLVSPDRMYGVARPAELLSHLDRAARLRAIRGAVEHELTTRIFVNFNPTALYDPAFCLRTTIRAIEAAAIPPGRMVFEVVESDRTTLDLSTVFAIFRDAGFRVALDDLGAGYGSLNLLSTLKPDFVKIDMKLIRDVDRDPYKAGITRKIVEMAQGLGISTVAEGIETEEELAWVEEHGVDFVQGYLLALPACPPPLPRPVARRPARPEVLPALAL